MTSEPKQQSRPVSPGLAQARRRRADRARQVADVLRHQLVMGAFASGALPAESCLAAEFGVSRNAVRDALGLLRADRLVERVPGVGTRVTARKYPHGLEQLLGLAEMLCEHGEIENEIRGAGMVTPPPAVARRLQLPAGSGVVCIERLRRLNSVPLSLDLSYLAPDIGERLLREDLVHNDLFVLIERLCQQRLGSADVTVEAITPDPRSAGVLEAPHGAALLMVERLTCLAGGRPVDLEYIRFRGDRLTLRGRLHRPAPAQDRASPG
jgi:GntR family transcriptional regulator